MIAVPVFWGIEIWLVWHLAGPLWAGLFAASLPALCGVLAYRYLAGMARLRSQVRFGLLALTRRQAPSRLLAARQEFIALLEQAKTNYFAATRGSTY